MKTYFLIPSLKTTCVLVLLSASWVAAQNSLTAIPQTTESTVSMVTGQTSDETTPPLLPPIPQQFTGSVPQAKPVPGVLQLHLTDALNMALRANLGVVEANEGTRAAGAERLRSLSNLLPQVSGTVQESVQQNNLAAFGISIPGFPRIVGPFGLSDARGFVSQRIFDWNAIQKERSAALDQQASRFGETDAREIVVLVVANQYLQTVATEARVTAAASQLSTAKAFFDQATTMKKAGLVAGLDVLRAQVEMQQRQQRLLFLQNEFDKEKLDLAREIGLASGQQFDLADKMPYAPAPEVDLDKALADAYAHRADYQRAQALLNSAQRAGDAARAEHYPWLRFDGNYGDQGPNFTNAHGTFAAAASLQIPIFAGGKEHADVLHARALLAQRQAELGSLKGDIDAQVRKALFDVRSAADQVQVTEQEVSVARQALDESRDRFVAGVADNLEVVQAQEALANANEAYISSVYAHNIAKASLARAVGVAETSVKVFLGENH